MRFLFCFLVCTSSVYSAEYSPINRTAKRVIPIWSAGPPDGWIQPDKEESIRSGGVTRVSKVQIPTLAFYPAEKENGAAVIICPGGAYRKLAYDKEGEEIAEWLNEQGMNAFLLKYRLPLKSDIVRHIPPLQDAQRSVSLVRSLAREMKIDENNIGIMGFSAGGHLSVATSLAKNRSYKKTDSVDNYSCAVDFTILVYPAYLSKNGNLTDLIRVDAKTPPTIILHAEDDRGHFANSPLYHKALAESGADSTLKTYKTGGHGHGLRKTGKEVDRWPADLSEWLKRFK